MDMLWLLEEITVELFGVLTLEILCPLVVQESFREIVITIFLFCFCTFKNSWFYCL